MKIYIDESGFTGADYCNEDQPLYVLACTWFDDDFAKSIEDPIVGKFGHKELKFNKLVKTNRGRTELRKAIDNIARSPEKGKFSAYVVDKKTALVRKFVMDCIEPVTYAMGHDLLKDGGTVTYANLLHCTLPVFMGQAWFKEFLLLYNDLIRSKSRQVNQRLHQHCR